MPTPKVVLLVGEYVTTNSQYPELLRAAHYLVEMAPTSSAALELLAKGRRFYGIIIDLDLADGRGDDVVLACQPRVQRVRVIALTDAITAERAVRLCWECATLPRAVPPDEIVKLLGENRPLWNWKSPLN